MRRFQLLLFFRSFRWVAPALVLFTWLVNLLTTGTGFALASSLFPAFLLWSLWATIALGNMHDKPTRDLLAATAGSSARFHSSIWSTVAVISLPLIAVVGVYVAAMGGEPRAGVGAFLSATCATVIGLALGSCLHQPVTNNRSIAILGSVALYIGVILLPPITAAHESLSQGRLTPVVVLVLVCCLCLITITKGSALRANTRAASH